MGTSIMDWDLRYGSRVDLSSKVKSKRVIQSYQVAPYQDLRAMLDGSWLERLQVRLKPHSHRALSHRLQSSAGSKRSYKRVEIL